MTQRSRENSCKCSSLYKFWSALSADGGRIKTPWENGGKNKNWGEEPGFERSAEWEAPGSGEQFEQRPATVIWTLHPVPTAGFRYQCAGHHAALWIRSTIWRRKKQRGPTERPSRATNTGRIQLTAASTCGLVPAAISVRRGINPWKVGLDSHTSPCNGRRYVNRCRFKDTYMKFSPQHFSANSCFLSVQLRLISIWPDSSPANHNCYFREGV